MSAKPSTFGMINNLTLNYNGNQLTSIADAVNPGPLYTGAFNFVDSISTKTEYKYDSNGNLTEDLNKKIAKIQYNILNLPSALQFTQGHTTEYLYDAAGVKRRVKQITAVPDMFVSMGTIRPVLNDSIKEITQTDYCGNVIYENGVLSRILVDGGYITMSGTIPTYHYYIQDHQGNNRVVFNQSGTVEQTNHYYPFGMTFGEGIDNSDNRYKYNGKELDRMHGLDLYDYGARHYDAAIGRWGVIDPHVENYYSISPYAYCANNPIRFVDPTGMDYGLTFDDKAKTVTVNATYYATSSSLKSANQSAKTLNQQSGNYTYTVGKGDDATTYKVNFEVKVVEVKIDPNLGEMGSLNTTLSADNSGQGNVYIVVPDSKLDANTNGATINGNYIQVKYSQQNANTGAHEMGHSLGLDHDTKGLMTPSSTDPNRSSNVNKRNVNDMISYPLGGKVNYEYDSNGNKVNAGKGTVNNITNYTNDELKKGKVN